MHLKYLQKWVGTYSVNYSKLKKNWLGNKLFMDLWCFLIIFIR